MDIIQTTNHNGFDLYSDRKAAYGFFKVILDKIMEVKAASLRLHTNPTAIHFIIDQPNLKQLARLSEILNRWQVSRNVFNRRTVPLPLYLYALETRPRTGDTHAHLMVILDGANFADACSLRDSLVSVSSSRTCKLARRKITSLEAVVDKSTGEILTDENHGIARKGSTLFHRLRTEFKDAVERFSYIAKRFSKSSTPIWSSSRIQHRLATSTSLFGI